MPIVTRMSAVDVLRAYWDGKLPVKPAVIARKQGIKVESRPDLSWSGEISRDDTGNYIIVCNESDHPIRQRFTLAHELGHFNLGHLADKERKRRDYPAAYTSSNADPSEREANDFAARLLMPAEAIDFVMESGRAKTLEEMARLFGVSTEAMGYRLKNMGYHIG